MDYISKTAAKWFGCNQEQRLFDRFDGCAWRVTWNEHFDEFAVEVSTEDAEEHDRFSTEREWIPRSHDHGDYWVGVTLFNMNDEPFLGHCDVYESQVYNLATLFMKLGYYDSAIATHVVKNGIIEHHSIQRAATDLLHARD